jgi:hypothetical protein
MNQDRDADPIVVVFWATLMFIPAVLIAGFLAAIEAMADEAKAYCQIMKNPRKFGKGKLK